MKQLELKHIAAYLPYDLKVKHPTNNKVWILSYDSSKDPDALININATLALGVKPILHPLSDLTRKIEHKGEWFVPANTESLTNFKVRIRKGKFYFFNGIVLNENIDDMPYHVVEDLLSWHFDINGLIEAGLAIDINTLNEIKQ